MATETKVTNKATIKYGKHPALTLSYLKDDVNNSDLYQFSKDVTKLMVTQEGTPEVTKRYEYLITN